MNLFECKIKYDKLQENGIQKTVTEPYLLDALSFTEAEKRIVEEVQPFISGEFTISDIKRKRFAEVLLNDRGDRYYKARLQYLTLDEKSGTEKKTNVNMLVQASSLREALEIVEKEMDKTMIDYVIHTISETPIMDLFPYKSENDE
ncbi:hypothetical protein DSECCO2_197420 [anaerobic digester metagenome]